MTQHQVQLPDNTRLPCIGQGTWFMGETPAQFTGEVNALRAGLDLGLTLIDTAEMYADGGAERVVGEAIRGRRDEVFLVSKVYPWNAGGLRAIKACEESLQRLGTETIDLYLLHWRGDIPLQETVKAMAQLMAQGKIKRWGVSNLDTADMAALWRVAGGDACMTNQVLYHLASRGIEYDLLPWCRERGVPVMAYCPLAQAGRLRSGLMAHPRLCALADNLNITVAQLLLAWVVRQPGVMAIPKAATTAHVAENARVVDICLPSSASEELDTLFAPPVRKMPLEMV